MATIFGKTYSRTSLLRYVGDISQIARVKPYRLVEGFEQDVMAADLTTGGGLTFTVLPSRGMDISSASFNGRPLAWRSATTDRHPAFFEPEGLSWLRSFYGGLVVTCGLTWAGAACTDEGKELGLHGWVSNTPAVNVAWGGEWTGDDYEIWISGKLREAIVFGENVELTRTIRARLGENRFWIHDRVENMGYRRTEHMFLYHINIGFPAISDHTALIAPTLEATPRDAEAEMGKERYAEMQPPTPDYNEKVYFHRLATEPDGKVTTALVNPELDGGYGVYCTFNQKELPYFIEWKMMDAGTYVVGMEPANALVLGRATERAAGRLQFLEGGEVREYHLEIGVVDGAAQLNTLRQNAQELIRAARK